MGKKASKPKVELDIGEVIDRFPAVKYLGSVPCAAAKGADVAAEALNRLRAIAVSRTVDLCVTTVGIFVFDSKTQDILRETPINMVSFVAQDPNDSKVVGYFENDQALRLITVQAFRLPKEAFRVPVAINDSFKVLSGEMEAPSAGGKKIRRQTSKKEAIAASNAKVKEVEKGEERGRFLGTFLGFANVSLAKGDEVADEAEMRIRKAPANDPCEIVVYEKAFEVRNTKTDTIIHLNAVTDVTFARYSEDKTMFTFILNDRRLDKITCSLCSVEPLEEGQPSIRRLIDAAQRQVYDEMQKERQRRVSSAIMDGNIEVAKASEEVSDTVLGVFEATYMGAVNVKEPKGDAIITGAFKKVSKIKAAPESVFVQITVEGIKILGALSSEVLAAYPLKNISFSTVTGKQKNVLAFTQRDDSLGLINCHFCMCAGERAFDIATCLGSAFKKATEELKKKGGNPFAPVGEREDPPAHLFDKQVHRIDLVPLKPIGAGQFGQVYLANQAVADGTGDDGGNFMRRAVKMLRSGATADDKEEFLHEVESMLELGGCDDLVNLVGVSVQQRPWLMVLPFLPFGDLRSLLRGAETKGIELNEAEQLTMALHVANGMAFIASKQYIHMDLAARNCLVGENNHVKVADFGLTRKLPDGQKEWHSDKVLKLPVKWCSIEALDDRIFSEGSDVWAFGVVLWEIASYGAMPYPSLKSVEVQRRVREGLRLEQQPNSSNEYHAMCKSCWAVERSSRPTFSNLAKELQTTLRTASARHAVRDIGLTVKEAAA